MCSQSWAQALEVGKGCPPVQMIYFHSHTGTVSRSCCSINGTKFYIDVDDGDGCLIVVVWVDADLLSAKVEGILTVLHRPILMTINYLIQCICNVNILA